MIQNDDKKIAIEIVPERKNILLFTNRNMLLNLCIILLENSVKEFHKNNTPYPKVSIHIASNKKGVEILFKDNAGGIKISPIEKVFEKDFSNSNSTGLGLTIAKEIVEKKLEGTIKVQNQEDGVLFIIKFYKESY